MEIIIKNLIQNSKKGIRVIIGLLLTVVSFAMLFNIAVYGLGQDIWYDEVFSLGFVEKPFRDIVELTSMDVHPPLYYFFLKCIIAIDKLIIPDISVITAAKMGSVIAGVGLIILILIVVTKRFGIFAAGICCFMTVTMPQIGNYYVEIRMYALAMLLVTSNLFLALEMVLDYDFDIGENGKLENKKFTIKALFLVLTGIMAAYTQYYAAIAIAGIYLAVLVIAFMRKNKNLVKYIFIIMVLSVILFLPWFGIVLKQMSAIFGKYWIQPMTIRSLAGCIKFAFMPATIDAKQNILGAGLLFVFAAGVLFFGFAGNDIKKNKDLIILCLAPIILVIFSGFVLSILGTPIFVYRYMIPTLPSVYLILAVILSKISEKEKGLYLSAVLTLLLTFGCGISLVGFQQEEGKKLDNAVYAMDSIDSIPEGAAVITNFDHVTAVMSYYLRNHTNNVYLYESECDPLIGRMFSGSGKMIDKSEMLKLAATGKDMVFLGSFNSRDELVQEFGTAGMDFEQTDSFLCERYWINKYQLKD